MFPAERDWRIWSLADSSSAGRIDLSACWLILQHIRQDYYIGLQTAFLMLWLLHGYWLMQSEFTQFFFFLHFILYILCSFNCFYIRFINLFRSYNPPFLFITFIILIMIKNIFQKLFELVRNMFYLKSIQQTTSNLLLLMLFMLQLLIIRIGA